ncbi:MAG TPA: NAD+ synthase [Acidimicrobiales bacterium]|nr:NAD+ synthase [Acidimicrobiales bacterium]
MSSLRIALCQLDVTVGDLEGNAEKLIRQLAEAEAAGADLAVFPELVLTGYPPEDLLLEPGFVGSNLLALEKVAAATQRCAAIVGFVEEDGDLYNAAAVCAGGDVHAIVRKQLLPNYGVFDERRYFAPGADRDRLFQVAGARVGVTICEDAWSPSGPVGRLGEGGAELVVTLNASPYRAGILAQRERMLSTRAADASCALAYVNLVGGQDELVFDGASMVFDHDGNLVASAPQFKEALVVCDLAIRPAFRKRLLDPRGHEGRPSLPLTTVSEPRGARAVGPNEHGVAPAVRVTPLAPVALLTPRLGPAAEVYQALVLGTSDYVRKNGFSNVLVALSGGVDSSLVATIAADALGPEYVHGVLMPSRFSSEGSVSDASALANNLGIDTTTIPIEPAHEVLLQMLGPAFGSRDPAAGLAGENLQARLRGIILMAISNERGWLVLTTGNKSEMAVGYATLYGDMAGGYAVLKDVPKMLVYELCEYRNSIAGLDLVPRAVLSKPPSAELRPDQRDDESLPPYAVLDPILEGYVEQDLTVADLVASGFEASTVRRIINLVDHAEYKRRQAPPGPRVTSRGFGKDRRMPITNRFRASAATAISTEADPPVVAGSGADPAAR